MNTPPEPTARLAYVIIRLHNRLSLADFARICDDHAAGGYCIALTTMVECLSTSRITVHQDEAALITEAWAHFHDGHELPPRLSLTMHHPGPDTWCSRCTTPDPDA